MFIFAYLHQTLPIELMLSSEDAHIIERLNVKDPEAINDLFNSFYGSLYSFASYMISDQEVAHDLVQDVFVRVWENAGAISLHTSLRNYLFAAVRYNCINHLKELNIEDRNNRRWLLAHIESETVDAIEDEEMRSQINQLIESLPKQCREIFTLRYHNGFTYKEISMSLNVSENVVKVQIHRAIKKLREKLVQIKDPLIFAAVLAILNSFTDK